MGQISLVSVCAAVVLAGTPAFASDWYVDAVHGNDANSGTSANDAWRTLTHAANTTRGTGLQTIHVAAGAYGAANGELFPIVLDPEQQLIGDSGGARPRIAGPAAFAMISVTTSASIQAPTIPRVLLENLVLSDAQICVQFQSTVGGLNLVLRDLQLEARNSGVFFNAESVHGSQLSLERVAASPAASALAPSTGVAMLSNGWFAPVRFRMSDCSISGFPVNASFFGEVDVRLSRCRLEGARTAGLQVLPNGPTRVAVEATDCSISGSESYGVRALYTYALPGARTVLDFARCTIADNADSGLTSNALVGLVNVALSDCIVANPNVDIGLAAGANLDVRNSLVLDGSLDGFDGNFSAEPQFVAPASLDYRLRWGSPCIDRIAAGLAPDARDADGRLRGVDGDLDLVERSDLGAFEFRPLELVSTGQLGSPLTLQAWGPQSAPSTVYWTRVGAVAPLATPFGEFELDPSRARVFREVLAGAATPTELVRQIPLGSLLIGQTFAFQALTNSAASPLGKAFTNVVEVTFTP